MVALGRNGRPVFVVVTAYFDARRPVTVPPDITDPGVRRMLESMDRFDYARFRLRIVNVEFYTVAAEPGVR